MSTLSKSKPRTLPSALRQLLHIASDSKGCKRSDFVRDRIISLLLQDQIQHQFAEVKSIIPWLYDILKVDLDKDNSGYWYYGHFSFNGWSDYMEWKAPLLEQLSDIANHMYNKYSDASDAHRMLLKKFCDHKEEICGGLTAAGKGD